MAGKSSMNVTQYQAIVTAYREVGNNASQIARLTGRNRDTIAKALRHGWPELGLPPVHTPYRQAAANSSATSSVDGASAASTSPNPGASSSPRPATSPDGFTAKQAAARRQEEDAIAAGVSNLVGSSIVTTKILQKLVEQAPNILAKIGADDAEAISPREFIRLVRELSKVSKESSASLAMLQAAGRLNTGEAGSITEHRHTGTVGVAVAVSEDPIEREKRLSWLIDIHQRARAHVPGEYRGEEQGIIDVTPEVVEASTVPASVALVALRDTSVEPAKPMGGDVGQAEANLRRALAARTMPAAQVDRVIDRARGKASREGRALDDVLEETLAAQPGRVA
jgi:hypothetical protein